MMRVMERSPLSKGGNTTAAVRAELPVSEYAKSKQSANISNTQAKRWQRRCRTGLGCGGTTAQPPTYCGHWDWSGQVDRSG